LIHSSTVLVLESDCGVRRQISEWLSREGYLVRERTDWPGAEADLRDARPDLVICGLEPPGERPMKRVATWCARHGVPILVLVPANRPEAVDEAIEGGADDLLFLPLHRSLVLAKARSLAGRRRIAQLELQYRRRVEQINEALTARLRAHSGNLVAAHYQAVYALSRLADCRDSDTGSHLDRIQAYAGLVAARLRRARPELALTESFVPDVAAASALHDVGKVALPDSILTKPGPLTAEERRIMQRHTVIGAEILRAVHVLEPGNALMEMGIAIAECHHERWNGTGYPHGLAGETIPLEARIVAIADVYDALTSPRCYRRAITHEEALDVLVEGRGTQFDPSVTDALLACAGEVAAVRSASAPQAA
jgi:putative two-component system response regulator